MRAQEKATSRFKKNAHRHEETARCDTNLERPGPHRKVCSMKQTHARAHTHTHTSTHTQAHKNHTTCTCVWCACVCGERFIHTWQGKYMRSKLHEKKQGKDLKAALTAVRALQHTKTLRASWQVTGDVVGSLYRLLMNKNPDEDEAAAAKIKANLDKLVAVASSEGPYLAGSEFTLADIHLMPFFSRFQHTLSHYRNFVVPGTGPASADDDATTKRLATWWTAVKDRRSLTSSEVAAEAIIKAYTGYASR
eukprot:m.312235 g.312235  ORF g.312235 m.312235 type:complete len:250 (+) comp19657_c1_seq14:454-1203(+)